MLQIKVTARIAYVPAPKILVEEVVNDLVLFVDDLAELEHEKIEEGIKAQFDRPVVVLDYTLWLPEKLK